VGDEHGLQGRFQKTIGQVLGSALEAQEVNLYFVDFKCLPTRPHKKDTDTYNGT
jgi:hypothetical protein